MYGCHVNSFVWRSVFIWFGVTLLLLSACQAAPETVVPPPATNSPTVFVSATSLPTTRPGETRAVSPTSTPTRTPSPTVRARGGAVTVAGVGALKSEVTALPDFVANALYDSLLEINPRDGSLLPGLAERWLVSDDAKTVVFILREDVRWHDGALLTADDVAFTLKTLSDAKTRLTPAADFGTLQDIRADNARTVTVTFSEPYCAALTYLGAVKILPKHVLENQTLANLAPSQLVGTGPLKLKTWQADALTFQANDAYWKGAPWLMDWTYRVYPNARAANDAVRQGQADVVASSVALTDAQTAAFADNSFYALAFNNRRAPFDDARVRQAFTAALDRAALAGAHGARLETSLLSTFWANPGNLALPQFDAARAKKLLADAGWRDTDGDGIADKDGQALSMTLWFQSDDPIAEETAQRVRAQLQAIGAQAILKAAERTLFLTRVFLQEFDTALVHFNIPLDPGQSYFWTAAEDAPGQGLNVTGYRNETVERAMAAGNAAAQCQPNARKQAYAPVWQALTADAPMAFLFAPARILNTRRVQGGAPSSFSGAFGDLEKWSAAP